MGIAQLPAGVKWDRPTKLLLWSGAPTPSGHPSWNTAATKLRTPSPGWPPSGRLLPALIDSFKRYTGVSYEDAGNIGCLGFSAGSNSGVRELLRNAQDRERLSFVAAIDGLHPNLIPGTADRFADWRREMGPFEDYAVRAARGLAKMVCTASQVAQPSPTNASTRRALQQLEVNVRQLVPASMRRGGPYFTTFPPIFGARGGQLGASPYLKPGEAHPLPDVAENVGNFGALYYPGTDKRAHQLQGTVISDDVITSAALPEWSPVSAQTVALVGEPPPHVVGAVPEEPAPSSAAPSWAMPAAVAALAAIGISFGGLLAA
jgi:hypothetical protein